MPFPGTMLLSLGKQAYDAVILRSCWDYHLRPITFLNWLTQLEACGVRVWNAPAIVRWNMDKRYLHELHLAGVPIPPSLWFDQGAVVDLHALFAFHQWSRVIIKPCISATAHLTWIATSRTLQTDQDTLWQLLQHGGIVIQPFLDEIATDGEWSFIFFDKQ